MGLALEYEQGAGVKLDLAQAAELYRKACDQNNANACDAAERRMIWMSGFARSIAVKTKDYPFQRTPT